MKSQVEVEPPSLEERYEAALLQVHRGVRTAQREVDAIEAEIAERDFAARRQAVLDEGLAKAAAIEQARLAMVAAQEAAEKRKAARAEVETARERLIKISGDWARAAHDMLVVAVEADNVSAHDEAAEILRSQFLKVVRDPFGRRLLNELGRPFNYGGGPIQ